MRTRALRLAVALCVAGTALGLNDQAPMSSVAWAQQPDAVTEVARQRYEEGVKAYDSGRFEDARSAFLQAYALKRHPAVLLNLGLSELKGKYPEDGGNHLQQFMREHTAANPDQKATAEKAIAEAKKKTAYIVVIIDANGADLSVDGANVGKAPLLDPFFVKPGKHTVLATFQGKSATTQVDARSGTATAANLTLGTSGTAPPPVVPVPVPTPPPGGTGTATPPPGQALPPPTGPTSPDPAANVQPYPPLGQPPPGDTTQPDTTTGQREPILEWYMRKPIAWVGTGVAGLGLLGGIIFSIAAASASSSLDKHKEQIATEASNDTAAGKLDGAPCGPEDSTGAQDVEKYRAACNAVRQDISDYDTDVALAVTGWVFFGVGVIGTVTYAMIDWYPKKRPTTGHIDMMPVIAPGFQGIGVRGQF